MAADRRDGARDGQELEVRADDDSKRTERAEMQAHEVIAADVLDRHPARAGEATAGFGDAQAESRMLDDALALIELGEAEKDEGSVTEGENSLRQLADVARRREVIAHPARA